MLFAKLLHTHLPDIARLKLGCVGRPGMVIGSMVIGSLGEMIHLKIGLRIGVNNIDPQLQRDILEIVGPKFLTLIKNLPETR